MRKTTPPNPIERRMMRAHKDWMKFAENSQARLLYWQTNEADISLVKALFDMQQQTSSCVQIVNANFESPEQYTQAIATQLIEYYDARRENTRSVGIVMDWQPPPREEKNETLIAWLLKLMQSLMEYHPWAFPGFLLVLGPAQIKGGEEAWQGWLAALLEETCNGPWKTDGIRYVQYGTEPPQYDTLIEQCPGRVMTLFGSYHMSTAPREIVAQSSERGPSRQFRRLLVQLSESLSHGDAARMERLRDAALMVSTKEGWHGQSAVVQLIAGAGYLKWKKEDAAHDAYGRAAQAGRQAQQAGDNTGSKLIINGLAGQAGVNVLRRKYRQAAGEYEKAAKVAEHEQDGLMAVEMRRMQGWSLEQAGRRESARRAGFYALADGEWLEPELREEGSLKLVSGWMWKQTTGLGLEKERKALEERLAGLYGREWPQKVLSGAEQQGLKARGVA